MPEKEFIALASMRWRFCVSDDTIYFNWAVVAASRAGNAKRICSNGVNSPYTIAATLSDLSCSTLQRRLAIIQLQLRWPQSLDWL